MSAVISSAPMRLACLAGALLLIVCLPPCGAQTAASTPINVLLPGAAHAAPPDWVKPGLRLTYFTAVASARGQGRDWKPDKNGGLVDAQGNHWSGDEKEGIGGYGPIQYDVVALDNRQVAIQQSSYMVNLQEPLTLLSSQGMLAPPGTGGDLWVDPALLKRLPDGMHAGYQVYRAPYRIGSATREGVWIHQDSIGGTMLVIYDRSTGILLHFASAGKRTNGPVLAPDEHENTSNIMLYQSTLTEQRMLKLPWMAGDVSGWTAHAGTLHYQGVATTGSPVPGSMPIHQRVTETLTLQSHSSHWALFTANFQAGGLSTQTQVVEGGAQTGALWIAPQTLARLQSGQEIDRDRITGVVLRVGRSSGASETILSTVGPTFQFDFHYDRSTGDLIGLNTLEHHPYVVKKLDLTLRR